MTKYVLKRLLHGIVSIMLVVAIVMILVYGLMDRNKIFVADGNYNKQANNNRITYRYRRWEEFGYLDYVPYADYVNELARNGELDEEARAEAVVLGRADDGSGDSELTAEYVQKFTDYYESKGYQVTRLKAVVIRNKLANGGQAALFAYKDNSLLKRFWTYFTNLFFVDNVHYVPDDIDIGERKLEFTLYDPLKVDPETGEKVFSPAIIGNGTMHKYLLYCNDKFPYIHQNLLTVHLGTSFSVSQGVDVFQTMTQSQGAWTQSMITYPSGLTELSADDLHSATYIQGSKDANAVSAARFTDDYTNVSAVRASWSRMGFSFVIGIIATIFVYIIGLPLGVLMARYKEGLFDKAGTVYIMFISAVPSLAYIFIFKGIGRAIGLPVTFLMDSATKLMLVMPVVSLALPSIANLMKWMRRYMIDQMNSDYVKFARSGGLSEGEIFYKHIMKNAAIPITHGIPGSLLFAMTGSLITERVYSVPGAGKLLTDSISKYDNGVIVGVTLFFALLSVIAAIMGDVLMAVVDPRINFTNKAR